MNYLRCASTEVDAQAARQVDTCVRGEIRKIAKKVLTLRHGFL
jgi:hypothetical protein